MKQTRTVEIVTGAFIILGFVALWVIATYSTNIQAYGTAKAYAVSASFNSIGGLKERAPVTIAGVEVGRVTQITLDPKSFNALVTIKFDSRYATIPDDSTASILTSGLLGEQYIGINPGGSETYLKDGSSIQYTQSALVLENLIAKFLSGNPSTSLAPGGK
jgi:phospholipid/cholesterol/gamma-HCH transport system substrate-binding protein